MDSSGDEGDIQPFLEDSLTLLEALKAYQKSKSTKRRQKTTQLDATPATTETENPLLVVITILDGDITAEVEPAAVGL